MGGSRFLVTVEVYYMMVDVLAPSSLYLVVYGLAMQPGRLVIDTRLAYPLALR